jgi:hypothetical protein
MSADILLQAVDAAARLNDAHWRRPFEPAATRFVRLLGSVPDCGAHEISDAEVRAMQRIAEGVIGRIEARIDAGAESAAIQRALAGTVYEIRRLLEEVYEWRRHFGARRLS